MWKLIFQPPFGRVYVIEAASLLAQGSPHPFRAAFQFLRGCFKGESLPRLPNKYVSSSNLIWHGYGKWPTNKWFTQKMVIVMIVHSYVKLAEDKQHDLLEITPAFMLRCQIRFCEPQGRCCHGPCTAAPAPRISAGGLPFFLVPGKYVKMPWHCHPTIPSRPRAQHKIPLTKPWTDPMLNITKPGFLMDSLQHPKMKPATRPSLPCVWRSRVGSIEASKSSMRFRKSPSSCC